MMHDTTGQDEAGPAFSVVIPLYNKRAHIRRTMERVLDQTHRAFEVIVVDDGSTDGGLDEIADLADDRIRILRQPNGGPGAARNRGIAAARHDWIAFLDADDAWYPDHLAELARAIAACPNAGMASTAFVKQAGSPALPPRPDAPPAIRETNYFEACQPINTVFTSTLAVRRALFDRVGGFGDFCPGEDTEMWARLSFATMLAVSSRRTAIYTIETGGISDALARARRVGRGARDRTAEIALHDLLDAKLNDPAQARLRPALRTYIDARALSAAKNALYHGDRVGTRRALDRVGRRGGARYALYRLLSLLPGGLTVAAATIWSRRRRREQAR